MVAEGEDQAGVRHEEISEKIEEELHGGRSLGVEVTGNIVMGQKSVKLNL